MKRSMTIKLKISACTLAIIMAFVFLALTDNNAYALNEKTEESFLSPVMLFSDFLERVDEYNSLEKIDELKIKQNNTEILENVIISENAIINIPEDAALIISGNVENYGQINVYGKLIVKAGASLTGDVIPGKGHFQYGNVKIYQTGVMYVENNAVHNISNGASIENSGTYLLDGILITNGEIKNSNLIKLGKDAKLNINAVLLDNGDIKSAETQNNYNQLKGGNLTGEGRVSIYRTSAKANLPSIYGMTFNEFQEAIEIEWV